TLAGSVAYQAAMAAAPRDPERAGKLAAAIAQESLRGMVWDQIGRAWLRRGDWPRALSAAEAAAGPGRVSLLAELARQASGRELLPGIEELSLAFAQVETARAVAVAHKIQQLGGGPRADGAAGPGEESLARLAAGVTAFEVERAGALLVLIRDRELCRAAWE